jgi:hypothetical protein
VKALIGAGADLNLQNKVSGEHAVELATFAVAPLMRKSFLLLKYFTTCLPHVVLRSCCLLCLTWSALLYFSQFSSNQWCALTFSFLIAWLDGAQNGLRLGPHSRSTAAH